MSDRDDNRPDDLLEGTGDGVSRMVGPTATNVQTLHILMLAGVFTGGVTALIALIFAYVNRQAAPDWLYSHYEAIIRTFWLGVLAAVVSLILMFFAIGFLTLLLTMLWWLVRSVQGLVLVSRGQRVENPETWGVLR